MKTVSQILQEGKARIETGWVQGHVHLVDPIGRHFYCALGAVWCRSSPGELLAVEAAFAALARALPPDYWPLGEARGSLSVYNDAAGRTKADILALYDRALTEVTK